MAGKHARPRIYRSPVALAATVAVVVAVAVGGTLGAVHLTSQRTSTSSPAPAATGASPSGSASTPTPAPTSPEATADPKATTSPEATSSPKASRSAERASRGNTRKAAPSPTTKKTPGSGRVVGSGSCGASFYAQGQVTANGESFNPEALTAAHKTWAFNTRVRVTNPDNGKSVVVRINDRGPYIDGRCIDLSRAAFRAIASLDLGAINVRYEILDSSGN